MRKPVAVPVKDAAIDGTINRRPEEVADSRSTAWKYRGMLKVTALEMMAPILLLIIRPPRGFLSISFRGMMGRSTYDST